jgi:hypothetical protein
MSRFEIVDRENPSDTRTMAPKVTHNADPAGHSLTWVDAFDNEQTLTVAHYQTGPEWTVRRAISRPIPGGFDYVNTYWTTEHDLTSNCFSGALANATGHADYAASNAAELQRKMEALFAS